MRLQRLQGNSYVQALLTSQAVQAKLTESQPGDPSEREADVVADLVTDRIDGTLQSQKQPGEELVRTRVQRQEVCEGEGSEAPVSENVKTRIERSLGAGQPIDDSTHASLEPHFGHDFSRVRVHTDAESDSLNRRMDAEAFTSGTDIFFKGGNYQPDNDRGRRILAHELTHVVQQGNAAAGINGKVQHLQLLRSGTAGMAAYEESSTDVIIIRMPYQIDSFDQILANVDSVVRVFGSSSRPYTNDPDFQSGLRSYLRSIHHASLIGTVPGMSREPRRTLSFTVRLIREGQRIETIEFATATAEAATEVPPTSEEAMLTELAEREARPPQVAPQPTGTRRPAASLDELLTEYSFSEQAAQDIDSLADLMSARWLWDPITARLSEYDEELDNIGENFRTQPVLGQALIPIITHLSVLLDAIVGTLDLCARIPAMPARVASVALEYHAGSMSTEELWDILTECGEEALNILSGGLITAAQHLAEGVRELNPVQFIRGVDELVLAVLSLIGMFRGLRSLRSMIRQRRTGVGAPARTPVAQAPTVEAVAEELAGSERPAIVPPEPRPGLRPARPAEGFGPTEPGEAFRPTEPAEALRPTEPGEALRPTEVGETRPSRADELGRSTHGALRPTEPGEALRPTEPGEGLRPTAPAEEAIRPTEPGETFRSSEQTEALRPTERAVESTESRAPTLEAPAEAIPERGSTAEAEGRTVEAPAQAEARQGRVSGGGIWELRIGRTFESVAEAQRILQEYMSDPVGRQNVVRYTTRQMQANWEAFRQTGPAPVAFESYAGQRGPATALKVNADALAGRAPVVEGTPGPTGIEAWAEGPAAEPVPAGRPPGAVEAEARPARAPTPEEAARTGRAEAVPEAEGRRGGAGETPGGGIVERPPSADAAPPGEVGRGINIDYIIREVADVRQMRDQIMRGQRPGRLGEGATSVVQGEWEAAGGRGTAPPGWWQSNGQLRVNFERVGWAAPELELEYAGRMAQRAGSRRAGAPAGRGRPRTASPGRAHAQPEVAAAEVAAVSPGIMLEIPVERMDFARRLMTDPRVNGILRVNAANMQRAYQLAGGTSRTVPGAFLEADGRLVVNTELLGPEPSAE